MVRIKFSDKNVAPGSTKYVDPGMRLNWAKSGTCSLAVSFGFGVEDVPLGLFLTLVAQGLDTEMVC